MALTSQPHLSQHVLHHRHCHVTFSVFLPSLSLSLCLCPFFIASSHYALLCLALFNFHISLSLSVPCFRRCNKSNNISSDSVTCNMENHSWINDSNHSSFYSSSTLFLFLCSSFSSNTPNPLIISQSFITTTLSMGCFHSKTAHLHSPEDPPTALPDSKKPDPGN
jgi:hypothetical protein